MVEFNRETMGFGGAFLYKNGLNTEYISRFLISSVSVDRESIAEQDMESTAIPDGSG